MNWELLSIATGAPGSGLDEITAPDSASTIDVVCSPVTGSTNVSANLEPSGLAESPQSSSSNLSVGSMRAPLAVSYVHTSPSSSSSSTATLSRAPAWVVQVRDVVAGSLVM